MSRQPLTARPSHPERGPNLRPIAADLVRESMQAQLQRFGARGVEDSVRRRTRGMPGDQRQALITVLAWVAADLALQLPESARQQTLARCEMTDRELHDELICTLTGEGGSP